MLLLEKLSELIWRKIGISSNCAHCVGIDRIVPRDSQPRETIRHDGVLSLAYDAIALFLEYPYGLSRTDAGNLRHLRPSPFLQKC